MIEELRGTKTRDHLVVRLADYNLLYYLQMHRIRGFEGQMLDIFRFLSRHYRTVDH
jgi:hypothetical protein